MFAGSKKNLLRLVLVFNGQQRRKIQLGMSIPDYYWMADSDVIDINAVWLIVLTIVTLLVQLGKTFLQETSH